MSDRIEIFGIEAFGFHGVFAHEKTDGQIFRVDVVLDVDLSKAAESDELADTVDYGAVSDLVATHIAGPSFALIEKLAGTIATSLLSQFPSVQRVSVTVHKPQAPIAVKFGDVAVTINRQR